MTAWLTRWFGFTETFWAQTRERVIVGAMIGATSSWLAGMSMWQLDSWKALIQGAVVGAGGALAASIIGSRGGNPDSPLLTAPPAPPQEDR